MSVYNKVGASTTRAVGEFPSSNNLRLQNLVESQLEITKTESCLIALSAKFSLEKSSLSASRLGLLIYSLQERPTWPGSGPVAMLRSGPCVDRLQRCDLVRAWTGRIVAT
ncbi:hypothetical protein DY000_02031093 [Brassica cretica]|uniref:Uncharacterized protein n=1 Tax=Brassica cretica TaxID=69181 RepID=A0ABQ7DE40_BRACR|nr:hypothetical protein DY000_02031093 [Brassica cretica]